MSAEKKVPNRVMFSKDFLLQFSGIQKKDPTITEKLSPYLASTTAIKSTRKTPKPNDKKPWPQETPTKLPAARPTSPRTHAPVPPITKTPSSLPNSNPNSFLKDPQIFTPQKNRPFSQSSPIFRQTSPRKATYTPVVSPSATPATPARVVKTPAVKETPGSPPRELAQSAGSIGTPVASPGRTAGSPKSPFRSPPRPISPLDEQRLMQRQKQIDYGYRTVGYLRYRLLVAKDQRRPEHPRTPKKNQGCSKRSWDGQLKKWRRDLHLWDPDSIEAFRAVLDSELVVNIIKSNPELEEIVRIVKEKMDNPSSADLEELENSKKNENSENSENKENGENEEDEDEEETEGSLPSPRVENSRLHKVARTLVF